MTKTYKNRRGRCLPAQAQGFLSFNKGFSTVEALVTLLVFSVAMVGTAALMTRTMGVRRTNERLIEAKNLAKSKLDQLTHVEFNLLGTGSTDEEEELWGGPNGKMIGRQVNGKGKNKGWEQGKGNKHKYLRSFVVCLDDSDGGNDINPDTDYACADTEVERPSELSCDTSLTAQGEAQIRVLSTFRTSDGKCHKFGMSQIVTNLQTQGGP